MPMTQQYLCGELTSRLGRLERVAAGQQSCDDVRRLRRSAECAPPYALRAVARRVLQLADALCWEALEHGDVATFIEEAAIAADLLEFATCAQLLDS